VGENGVSVLVLFSLLILSGAYAGDQPSVDRAMQLVAAGKLDLAASMLGDLEKADPRHSAEWQDRPDSSIQHHHPA
jgi:hypothetical protein